MKNNILIITGGTGGHVIPALNFFNYINKQLDNIFIITDYRGTKYIKNINNKKIFQIQSSHLAGNILFKLKAIVKLFIGFIQSIYIFIKIRPNVIISFGSYASVTPLICFYVFKFFFKTKLYIHEQNSVIGQTNKLFAKIANKIFVNYNIQYPSIKKYKSKIVVAGLPQKINFNYLNNKKNNSSNFNFLVFAGSQGSVDILEIFSKIIDKFDNNISVIKTIKFIVQSPKEKQNPGHKLYNIGNNKPEKLLRYIQVLEESIGKPAILEFSPMQPGDVLETYADITSIQNDFDFSPRTPIEKGIPKFVDWYKNFYQIK